MNWNDLKTDTQKVYPKSNKSIGIMQLDTGKMAIHWADRAYDNYAYKSYCPYNFMITINLWDFEVAGQDADDTSNIEKYFENALRSVCICHGVANISAEESFTLYYYADNAVSAFEKLTELENDPDKLIKFSYEVNDDPKWELFSNIFSS